jgi:hypothetical protein
MKAKRMKLPSASMDVHDIKLLRDGSSQETCIEDRSARFGDEVRRLWELVDDFRGAFRRPVA